MCELETLMAELLELAKNNPDLLFKITPNEAYTGWGVEFIKGGHWWGIIADYPDEPLTDVIKEALAYFERLTDEFMETELQRMER